MNLDNPIAVGNTASVYHYEDKAIKVFNDFLPEGIAAFEAKKQDFAYSCGLPVPKVFDITRANGKQAIIMEYISGPTIGDLIQKDTTQTEYYMKIAVDIQMKIHAVSANSIELMSEKLSRQIKAANNLNDDYRSTLLQKLDSISFDNKLCHGDFHVFNLVQEENRVVIIDWIDSSSGSACADAYRSYLLLSQNSNKLADIYLNLYCEKSRFTKEEILLWTPIIAGARLSENMSSQEADKLLEIVSKYCPL